MFSSRPQCSCKLAFKFLYKFSYWQTRRTLPIKWEYVVLIICMVHFSEPFNFNDSTVLRNLRASGIFRLNSHLYLWADHYFASFHTCLLLLFFTPVCFYFLFTPVSWNVHMYLVKCCPSIHMSVAMSKHCWRYFYQTWYAWLLAYDSVCRRRGNCANFSQLCPFKILINFSPHIYQKHDGKIVNRCIVPFEIFMNFAIFTSRQMAKI